MGQLGINFKKIVDFAKSNIALELSEVRRFLNDDKRGRARLLFISLLLVICQFTFYRCIRTSTKLTMTITLYFSTVSSNMEVSIFFLILKLNSFHPNRHSVSLKTEQKTCSYFYI